MTGKRPVRHRRGPPGTPHRFWNDADEEARALVKLRPALNSETFFETLYGLPNTAKPTRTAYLASCSKRSHSLASTRARSTSPSHLYRYRRRSWRCSLQWEEDARVQRPLSEVQHRSGDFERRGSWPAVYDNYYGEGSSPGGLALRQQMISLLLLPSVVPRAT